MSSDNLLDGTPIPLIQMDANTAPTADRSPQDNSSSANGTSDQPIHSSKSIVPHTDTSQASPYDTYYLTSTLSDCFHQEQYQSYINSKLVMTKDASVQAVIIGDQRSNDVENKSDRDIGENHPFPMLNPEDRVDREAQLSLSADSMKTKFASLLVDVIMSFKDRGINPDDITSCILAITEHNPAISKPLLERLKEDLNREQNVNRIFNIVGPHMTFFNHEILTFVIKKFGSPNDKYNLQIFLQEFNDFCRRSVFELPSNTLGHSEEKAVGKQKFGVKITNEFKAALLVQSQEYDQQATSSNPTSSDLEERERICAPELGISLEDAKHIQRKLALVLNLKASSIYLDSAISGCVILTFLLPSHISLAGLDSNPDAIALSDIGIRILCGPPGKPEPKELTSNGLVVQWSQPEYGCSTLIQYVLYYQSKDNETMPLNDWQKIEVSSQQTRACVPNLRDGDTYVFRVSSVSDAGTLQYSNESDSILISVDENLTNSISKAETLAISSADPSSASFEAKIEDPVPMRSDDVKVSNTHSAEYSNRVDGSHGGCRALVYVCEFIITERCTNNN